MSRSPTFCVLPFTSMMVHQDGRIATCCHGRKNFVRPDGKEKVYLYRDSFAEAFQSPTVQEIRQNLLNGIQDDNCASCWKAEKLGQKSPRQIENEIFHEEANAVQEGHVSPNPVVLNINPGNLCNLKCRICGPSASSRWVDEAVELYGDDFISRPKELQHLPKAESRKLLMGWTETNSQFWSSIEAWLPGVKLFNFTGGEPFLSKRHFEMLEKSVQLGHAGKQQIRYNSNGSIFPERAVNDIFPHFERVQVLFSLDGTGPRFEYQRHGARWEDAISNLKKFRELPNAFVGVCFTVSALNVFYLLEELEYWLSENVPVYLNVLEGPLCFNFSALPAGAKEALRTKFASADLRKFEPILMNRLEPVIAAIFSQDLSAHWPEFCEKVALHDGYRKESFLQVFPEYVAMLQETGAMDAAGRAPGTALPDSFCIIPWTSVQLRPDGKMAACAHSSDVYRSSDGEPLHLLADSVKSGFLSESARNLRNNLLSGVKDKNCAGCWAEEERGQKSKRQSELFGFEIEARQILKGDFTFDHPIFLDISPGNFCNLKCRICKPSVSSGWKKEAEDLQMPLDPVPSRAQAVLDSGALKDWSGAEGKIWSELEPWLPQVRKFNFVGGEPFLNKAHFEFLAKSVKGGHSRHQTLQYNTNGTVYPERALKEIFPHFQQVQIWVSLDDIGPRFEYQRQGASWERVLENLERFFSHSYVSYAVCLTVSSLNIFYLPEALEFWHRKGVKVYLGNVIGSELSIRALPATAKAAVRDRLLSAGLEKYESILVNRIEPFLELLRTEDEPQNWRTFRENLDRHDKYRGQSYSAVFPEAARAYGLA